ncbi:uncharacterized protein C8Q71DRAFT_374622 [Rhodofomes roseus]|uniref:Uncharacterized protein n=1 Tax=Rhodofomes roseus TaxID=34475 RepID=A0ABQ8K0U8_9APHY|nr:uncharacterized protein C8Q71DRAFT_374622 [Rhodofomes roseus]KAH9830302.1 hypothetical protein C8Q71DRAFT_374622 [Rhodofomes roseus]
MIAGGGTYEKVRDTMTSKALGARARLGECVCLPQLANPMSSLSAVRTFLASCSIDRSECSHRPSCRNRRHCSAITEWVAKGLSRYWGRVLKQTLRRPTSPSLKEVFFRVCLRETITGRRTRERRALSSANGHYGHMPWTLMDAVPSDTSSTLQDRQSVPGNVPWTRRVEQKSQRNKNSTYMSSNTINVMTISSVRMCICLTRVPLVSEIKPGS